MICRCQWFLGAAAVLGLLAAQSARADSVPAVTFAQFTEVKPQPSHFQLKRFSTDQKFGLATGITFFNQPSAGVAVNLDFSHITGAPTGDIRAHVFLSARSTTQAFASGANGVQPFNSQLNQLIIRRDSDNKVLLEVDFKGNLVGPVSGHVADLNASTVGGANPNTPTADFVHFSSAIPEVQSFLSGSTGGEVALHFFNIIPKLTLLGSGHNDEFLLGFAAGGSGVFSAAIVPEPGTLALGGIGVATLLGGLVRRRMATV
jgi:hypothetical protein